MEEGEWWEGDGKWERCKGEETLGDTFNSTV